MDFAAATGRVADPEEEVGAEGHVKDLDGLEEEVISCHQCR
jgi:hypothetical protein